MIAPLSRTYADARTAFLAAAAAAGAQVTSTVHPLTGLEGEELAVDVAEVGPADADDDEHDAVLIVVSATHGVEGYLGSALQQHHLRQLAAGPRPDTAVVFVHALNPYGFSWVRRVNEDNVDLNRNFVDWTSPPPVNEGYAELASTLVPTSWTDEEQQRTLLELLEVLQRLGMERLQAIVSGGQYAHPTGVFYGGTGPVWSHRWLREFLGRRLAGVARAGIVDLHTGLGPWGHGELISSERPGSEPFERQRAWWGDDVRSMHDGSSVSAELAGDWLAAVQDMAPGTEVTAVTIEYGTVDPTTVLQSLRADAVLHAHGDPTAPEAAAIRDQVRAAFADDDPAWLAACLPRYESVVATAVAALRDRPV